MARDSDLQRRYQGFRGGWVGRWVHFDVLSFRSDVFDRRNFGPASGWLLGLLIAFVTLLTFVYGPEAHLRADQPHGEDPDGRIPVLWGWITLGLVSSLALIIGFEPIVSRSALGRRLSQVALRTRPAGSGLWRRVYRWTLGPLITLIIYLPAFILNVLDWMLVRILSVLAGMTLGTTLQLGRPGWIGPAQRYGFMAVWGLLVFAVVRFAPVVVDARDAHLAGLAVVIVAIVMVFGVVRRWSWIERDREEFIAAQGWDETHLGRARIGFTEDLRDEAMVAIIALFVLFPLLLQHVDLIFDAFDPVDATGEPIPGAHPTLIQWIGFFGVELTKSAPFVDWSEVFHAANGSRIETTNGVGSIIAFLVRVFLDLLLLAAVIQALTLAMRLRAQKRAFLAGDLAILDPFEERRYFGDAGRELIAEPAILARSPDTATGGLFRSYSERQLRLIADGAQPNVPALSPALVDPDARRGALAVMARLHPGSRGAADAVLRSLELDSAQDGRASDTRVRTAALLGDMSGAANAAALSHILTSQKAPLDLRVQAARDAGRSRSGRTADALDSIIAAQEDPLLHAHAGLALAKLGRAGAGDALEAMAPRLTGEAAMAAAYGLGRLAQSADDAAAIAAPFADAESSLVSRAVRSGLGELDKTKEISAGTFLMGAAPDEAGARPSEHPQHEVTLARPFAMGVYAVTFEEYDAFCDATGERRPSDQGWGRDHRPVINVSWENAQDYLRWLNAWTGERYRLPTEAEWEYACRAGTITPFSFGETVSTDQANYNGNYTYGSGEKGEYRERTTPVGSFTANAFGLYEMHGNVFEWCADVWNDNYAGLDRPDDGRAWLTGDRSRRVLRGGSWDPDPQYLRSANRSRFLPTVRLNRIGFRVARTVLPE